MKANRPGKVLKADQPETVDVTATALREGNLVVLPTDTVYGVAAAVERPDAVARLFVAKGRPLERPIPVLISDFDQVERLSPVSDPRLLNLLRCHWPGALTVVLPAAEWLPPEIVRETGRVGIRMPDHDVARGIICGTGGALAVTSANRSGEREARSAPEALAALGDQVAVIVDGGPSPGGVPSTVISIDDGEISILRRGAIEPEGLPTRLEDLGS